MAFLQTATAKTFFDTRGKDRCALLNTWTDSIQARAPGRDLYGGTEGTALIALFMPSFTDAHFMPVFGERFWDLDDRQKKTVQNALIDCYGKASWQGALSDGFETNPRRMDMHWNERLAMARDNNAQIPRGRAVASAIPAGDALLSTPPFLFLRNTRLALQNLRLVPCTEPVISGAFFLPEIYGAIQGVQEHDSRGLVDGIYIDCTLKGEKLTYADIASVAAELFIRKAAQESSRGGSVVEAMRQGRFNPGWHDVALAWQGLVRMSAYALSPETIAALQRTGKWNNGSLPIEIYQSQVLEARPRAWQSRFGSFESLPQGDFLQQLFASLASRGAPPVHALTQYQHLMSEGEYGQRMAVAVRQAAEKRALDLERSRRYADMSEGDKFALALNRLVGFNNEGRDMLDAVQEAMLDAGGVAYANSGQGKAKVMVCNRSGKRARLAGMIQYKSLRDAADVLGESQFQVRGWSYLQHDQCAGIRTGIGNLVFLAIQYEIGDRFVDYSGASREIHAADLTKIVDRTLGADLSLCVRRNENFAIAKAEYAQLSQCASNEQLQNFNHAMQFYRRGYELILRGDL